jgi:hypothetical protein
MRIGKTKKYFEIYTMCQTDRKYVEKAGMSFRLKTILSKYLIKNEKILYPRGFGGESLV